MRSKFRYLIPGFTAVALLADPNVVWAQEEGVLIFGAPVALGGLIVVTNLAVLFKPTLWQCVFRKEPDWTMRSLLKVTVIESLFVPLSVFLAFALWIVGDLVGPLALMHDLRIPEYEAWRSAHAILMFRILFCAALIQSALAYIPNRSLVKQENARTGVEEKSRRTVLLPTLLLSSLAPAIFITVPFFLLLGHMIDEAKEAWPRMAELRQEKRKAQEISRRHLDGTLENPIIIRQQHGQHLVIKPQTEPQARPPDPNREETPSAALTKAIHRGNLQQVKELLRNGADPNGRPDQPLLIEAAMRCNLDMVKVLLESGADVNAKNKSGWTALMFATRLEAADIAELLLKHGADVNIKNASGDTCLSMAARSRHLILQELLKEHGAVK